MKIIAFLVLLAALLGGCAQSIEILEGATHAKASIHGEGFWTDSQGDLELCKVPDDYTAEDAKLFCSD